MKELLFEILDQDRQEEDDIEVIYARHGVNNNYIEGCNDEELFYGKWKEFMITFNFGYDKEVVKIFKKNGKGNPPKCTHWYQSHYMNWEKIISDNFSKQDIKNHRINTDLLTQLFRCVMNFGVSASNVRFDLPSIVFFYHKNISTIKTNQVFSFMDMAGTESTIAIIQYWIKHDDNVIKCTKKVKAIMNKYNRKIIRLINKK